MAFLLKSINHCSGGCFKDSSSRKALILHFIKCKFKPCGKWHLFVKPLFFSDTYRYLEVYLEKNFKSLPFLKYSLNSMSLNQHNASHGWTCKRTPASECKSNSYSRGQPTFFMGTKWALPGSQLPSPNQEKTVIYSKGWCHDKGKFTFQLPSIITSAVVTFSFL